MFVRASKWVLAAGLALCLIGPARAVDTVTKKSGGRVGGRILGSSKTELTIKPGVGDTVKIPANDVAAVDWDDASADLKLGIADENGGRFESALQRVTKSKNDCKTDSPALKAEFDFVLARVAARMALTDATKRDEAIKQLQAFSKSNADHFRYYESLSWLGQVQLAKPDFDGARKSYESLAAAPWNDYQLAGKIAFGRILMGENKLDEAVQTFDEAIAAAGNEAARKHEAQLGKVRALTAQSKHNDALPILDDVMATAGRDETALQAEAHVLQGNALQALNRTKEACLAYLFVDLICPRESTYHAEALYNLTRLWKAVQLPERGLEAEAKLQSAYPNSEWTKKLTQTP